MVGQVVLVAHLQRREAVGDWCPAFGWNMTLSQESSVDIPASEPAWQSSGDFELHHSFTSRRPHHRSEFLLPAYRIAHPAAPWKRRGVVLTQIGPPDTIRYRYLRSTGDDRVPHQKYAWRRAELVLSPHEVALPRPTLTSSHSCVVGWRDWDELYDTGALLLTPAEPLLSQLRDYHARAVVASAAVGSDWGNVTSYSDGAEQGDVFGMNRLNHCPAIFFEAMRTGNDRLADTAIAWCDNFYDLSIWWGPEKTGGTRYNNLRAHGKTPPEADWDFMWRGDESTSFCTKGYESFLLAYEETGDPRLQEALEAQREYAFEYVQCNDGECRNIGDVNDFVRLFTWTGDERYLEHGLRLFQQLRTKLSDDHLFSQGGQPIVSQPPYIDEDAMGMKFPFAKPYIIGYALNGCPRLARFFPEEPRLREMVTAVAEFLADSQDRLGGWRYPHPQSSRLCSARRWNMPGNLSRPHNCWAPIPRWGRSAWTLWKEHYSNGCGFGRRRARWPA